MNQSLLEEARAALASGPISLAKIHSRLQRAGSTWSEAQHCLFFLAFDGFRVEYNEDTATVHAGEQSPEDRLLLEVVKAVESFGGSPAPAKEIRKRLPPDIITSDQQVKAIAKKSQILKVVGAGLIKTNR